MQFLFIKPAAAFLAVSLLASCEHKPLAPEALSYEVVSVRPHDPDAYTQGFQLVGPRLFESTGLEGHSSIREVDAATGNVLRKRNLPAEIFGEGLTLHDKKIWMITWKNQTGYVLDAESFRTLSTFTYTGEGWGLTTDGKQLIMSDGSSKLTFRRFDDQSVTRTLEVTDQGRPLKLLNELEYINGELFANIYTTSRIARINPQSGEVTGWLDLSKLKSNLPSPNHADVLNGIAYDEKTGHLLVTGKWWPEMYEIKLGGK
jgi:glutamine cyclotransferase